MLPTGMNLGVPERGLAQGWKDPVCWDGSAARSTLMLAQGLRPPWSLSQFVQAEEYERSKNLHWMGLPGMKLPTY